jgi:hypothetical protein
MSSSITHGLQHKLMHAAIEKALAPRQFRFIISSETLDRDKDIIKLSAWNLDEYKLNPVVLANHAHQSFPVAKSIEIGVRGNALQATAQFPEKGVYDVADTVHDLVNLGYLKGASVGFRAHDTEPNGYGGVTIKSATLLEWSICPIGSNPDALIQRAAPAVMRKWLQSKHQHREDEMDTEMWLDVSDDFFTRAADDDPFQAMCDRMLEAYEEMEGDKFRQLMARQLALLGPNATISDLVRGIMQQGVVASRSWEPETFDIDEKELAVAIAQVIATETVTQTRAALNATLGRLD